jgi:hypothetical protein
VHENLHLGGIERALEYGFLDALAVRFADLRYPAKALPTRRALRRNVIGNEKLHVTS